MLDEFNESLIKKTAKFLGIPADVVRKDYYVTQAIHALTQIENECFSLLFHGGTSLSKGYKIISRLSEDVDFRVVLKPEAVTLGKEVRRKRLRDFRRSLVNALVKAGFSVDQEKITVFYEGRFMRIHAVFDGASTLFYLKPHIVVECFVGEVMLAPTMTLVTSLIKETLGHECSHDIFPVSCIAIDETAAEKWVALTRRISNTQYKKRFSDKNLVRHIYDLYQLRRKDCLTGQYQKLVQVIINKEVAMFKKNNDAYAENPWGATRKALDLLYSEPQWQQHWVLFCEQMVYGENKPSFLQAADELRLMSKTILEG